MENTHRIGTREMRYPDIFIILTVPTLSQNFPMKDMNKIGESKELRLTIVKAKYEKCKSFII